MGTRILQVCFQRPNDNLTWNLTGLVFEAFIYDGATFSEVLKDTPQYAATLQSSSTLGRIFIKLFFKLLHRKSFEYKQARSNSKVNL